MGSLAVREDRAIKHENGLRHRPADAAIGRTRFFRPPGGTIASVLGAMFLIVSGPVASAPPAMPYDLPLATRLIDEWRGQRKDLDDANVILERALRLDPDNVVALVERARWVINDGYMHGEVYKSGTMEKAIPLLRRAIDLDTAYVKTYSVLASALLHQNKLDEAERVLEAGKRQGDHPWLHIYYGELLEKRGRGEEAAEQFRHVLATYPDDIRVAVSALGGLSGHYSRNGEYDEADRIHREKIALAPDDAWILGNYAWFLFWKRGDFDGTISYAEKAVEIMNYGIARDTLAYGYYGKWAEMGGETNGESEAYLLRAVELYPDMQAVFTDMAYYPHTLPIAKALLKLGVDPNYQDREGMTALLKAVNSAEHLTLPAILEMGVNTELKDKRSWTPLALAAHQGKLEAVRMLVEYGADINGGAHMGQPPLWFAAARGHVNILDYLIAQGADINKTDSNGAIPVMAAAYYGHETAARRLVETGADLHRKTRYGQTAADLATERGHNQIAQYLRESESASLTTWQRFVARMRLMFDAGDQ